VSTAAQFLEALSSFEGMPYDAGPERLDPAHNGTDCSALIVRGLAKISITAGGENSEGLQEWCDRDGMGTTVDHGIHTAGALLFIWGTGPNGHVACSRGDGTTYETPAWGQWGHAMGIGDTQTRQWTGAALVPGLDYSAPNTSWNVPPLARNMHAGMSGHDVQTLQVKLVEWALRSKDEGFDPHTVDGIFGPKTAAAVEHLQTKASLVVDGVVGPKTWATLWAF